MMKSSEKSGVVVFGASRGVGRLAVEEALSRGHRVTAVARNTEALESLSEGVRLVQGSVTEPDVVDRALSEGGRVICALGAPAMSSSTVRSEGTREIVAGMKRRGLRRIAAVSVMGVGAQRAQLPALYRYVIFPLYLRKPVRDHERQEALLLSSGLDWVAVRPPNLTEEEDGRPVSVSSNPDLSQLSLQISRRELARYLVDAALGEEHSREAVTISTLKERQAGQVAA